MTRRMTIGSGGLRQWLIRATAGNFLMKVSATVLGFFTTLLLARLLSPEQYGAYAYALAWVNLLVVPAVIGLDKLVIRNAAVLEAERNWAQLRGLWHFSLLTAGGLGAALALSIHLLSGSMAGNWLEEVMVEPLRLALVLIPLIAMARVRGALMIGLHHVVLGKFPEILLRPLLFILFIFAAHHLFRTPLDAEDVVGMNIAAVVLSFAVGGLLLRWTMPAEVDRAGRVIRAKSWLRAALPLALLAGLQIINSRVDILMLGGIRGAVDVAVYHVVVQAAMLISFVLVAAGGVVSPVVARTYAQGELSRLQRLVTSSSRAIFAATLPVGIAMLWFGDPFLALFGESYRAGYSALSVLVIGQLLNAAFGAVGVLLTMTHHGGLAARGAAVAVVVNVLLNALLIPAWGATGAAIASTLTLFLWNLLFAFFVYREMGIRPTVIG